MILMISEAANGRSMNKFVFKIRVTSGVDARWLVHPPTAESLSGDLQRGDTFEIRTFQPLTPGCTGCFLLTTAARLATPLTAADAIAFAKAYANAFPGELAPVIVTAEVPLKKPVA